MKSILFSTPDITRNMSTTPFGTSNYVKTFDTRGTYESRQPRKLETSLQTPLEFELQISVAPENDNLSDVKGQTTEHLPALLSKGKSSPGLIITDKAELS